MKKTSTTLALLTGCLLTAPLIIAAPVNDGSGNKLNGQKIGAISLYVAPSGNVGIGTDAPLSTLAVNGRIRAKEIEVTLSGWPDYVFTKNYALKPLAEVEAFIEQNHHLPNVPSADEVLKNGSNLGEMDTILLRKIEELTLYMTQLKKANDQLSERIKTHENK